MRLNAFALLVPLVVTVACNQAPDPTTNNAPLNNKILGTVSLGIGTNASASSIKISSRAALPDNAISIGTPVFVDFVDLNTNTRYLSATFPVTNNTATAFDNLTLYAYNQNGTSLGGTAIKQLVNFVGAPANGAQSLLPIHKTDAAIPNPTIDSAAADFQGFTAVEASDVKTDAVAQAIITNSDTVLQYGYVARNGNSRTINAGGTGSITIAYRLPDANVSAAYKFVANFVVANVVDARVSRGLGDTTAAAIARANGIGAGEVFFVGSDTDTAPLPLSSERVKNISTSNSPVCLVSGPCLSAPTLSLTGAANSPTNAVYTLGIAAEPSAGSVLTDIEIDWGDGSPTETLAGTVTSATHTFTTTIDPNTISVTATDSSTVAGQTVTTTKNIAVLDAPTVSLTGNGTALTGVAYNLSITAAAAPGSTLSSVTVDWGDGSALEILTLPATSATHTFTSAASRTVTVVATDTNTLTASATVGVVVSLSQPTVAISGNATVDTGVLYTLGITTTAAAGSSLSGLTVDWGDGSALETLATNATDATHTFSVAGTPTITVTATDTNTAVATATKTVTVSLPVPTVTMGVNSGTASTGVQYTLNFTASPAAGSSLSGLSVDWGDGAGAQALTVGDSSATHTYQNADVGAKTITVLATDTNTATANATQAVTVSLSPPTVSLTGNATVGTGVSYSLGITATAAPGSTLSSLTVDWGDGSALETLLTSATSASHTFTSAAVRTVTVTATDTNTATASATKSVTVGLSLPTVSASGSATANTGVLYSLSITAASAPGSSLSDLKVNWGDGGADETLATSATSATHTFTAAGTPTITVTATDTNTASATATQAVTVSLSPPTVTMGVNSSTANTGVSYTLNFTAAAAPGSTLSSLKVNWGDGSGDQSLTVGDTSATHTFTVAGTPTITVTATDTNTATASATEVVTVSLSQPTVTMGVNSGTASTGVQYTLNFTASPAAGSSLSDLKVNWGDGGADETLATSATSASHTFTAAGTPTITVTATDTNTATANATQGVTVSLSQPTVTMGVNSSSATTGVSYTLNFTTVAAAGSSLSSLTVDWGDGSALETLATNATSATHTFTATGTPTITVLATDTNTATASATQAVTVSSPPSVTMGANSTTATKGVAYTLNFSTTAGSGLSSLTVDWGDGSAVETLATSATSATHTFSTTGAKIITVTATDYQHRNGQRNTIRHGQQWRSNRNVEW